MSDDQHITSGLTVSGQPASSLPHQTSIVLGQPVSDTRDSLVLGEPVLDDAQPIANGRRRVAPVEIAVANQDRNVQGDEPAVNGDPEPIIAQAAPVFVARADEGSGDRGIAPRSLEDPHADEAAQLTVVEPVHRMGEETQESALKEEEELEQKSGFDMCDRSAPTRGFGVRKPLIVAGMVIAVLGVVVAGIRKAA